MSRPSKQEDATNLRARHTEAHQHGDVARLLHHHHGERDENVQRGDDDDEREDDERDHLLEFQCAKELAILIHPVGGLEAGAGVILDLMGNVRGEIEVVEAEAQDATRSGSEKRCCASVSRMKA